MQDCNHNSLKPLSLSPAFSAHFLSVPAKFPAVFLGWGAYSAKTLCPKKLKLEGLYFVLIYLEMGENLINFWYYSTSHVFCYLLDTSISFLIFCLEKEK